MVESRCAILSAEETTVCILVKQYSANIVLYTSVGPKSKFNSALFLINQPKENSTLKIIITVNIYIYNK